MNLESLPQDISSAHALIIKQHNHIDSLERKVNYLAEKYSLLNRQLFGRSSERRIIDEVPPEQPALPFASKVSTEAPAAPAKQKISYERAAAVVNRKPSGVRFPAELPRINKPVAAELKDGVEYEFIRDEVTERLGCNDIQFHVVREIRPIYKEKATGVFVQPSSTALFDRCSVEPSFVARVIENKFCWHLPFYRQAQMLTAQGIGMSVDSLIDYVIRSGNLFHPIAETIHQTVLTAKQLHIDETPLQVGRKSGHGKSYKQSYLWPICTDEEISFKYAATRTRAEVDGILRG